MWKLSYCYLFLWCSVILPTVSAAEPVAQIPLGEFYSCKPDIFAKTYELVEEQP